MPKISELIGKKEKVFKPDGSRWPDLVGIELELEDVANVQELPYWAVKPDNSLRNGIEYVLDQPYGGPSLNAALDSYYGAKLRFENTIRTSTHIHVNVLDAELDAVRVMAMLMYTIEDGFYNVIEADRKWSGYSMPLSEMNSTRLRQIMSAQWPEHANILRSNLCPARNQERYYGFNLAATGKYGTIEFRYFPGGPAREELENWLDFCLAVKRIGVEIGTPLELIDRINNGDDIVNLLLDKLPGEWGKRIIAAYPAEQMLAKFNEIAALVTDYVIERREPMVFLTPALFKYVGKKLVNAEGLLYLEKLKPLGVLNAGEWDYHLGHAMKEVFAKPKLDKKKPTMRDYGDYRPRTAQIDPPTWANWDDTATLAFNRPAPPVVAQQSLYQLRTSLQTLITNSQGSAGELAQAYAAQIQMIRQKIRAREQQELREMEAADEPDDYPEPDEDN